MNSLVDSYGSEDEVMDPADAFGIKRLKTSDAASRAAQAPATFMSSAPDVLDKVRPVRLVNTMD
jgi:hypothetical protein